MVWRPTVTMNRSMDSFCITVFLRWFHINWRYTEQRLCMWAVYSYKTKPEKDNTKRLLGFHRLIDCICWHKKSSMPVSEIIDDWSTCVQPPKRAQYGIAVPTALIYKYCFYLELSTQEDMEIKCFNHGNLWPKKQTFWKCLSALTQLWQDFSLTCSVSHQRIKGQNTKKKKNSCFIMCHFGPNDSNFPNAYLDQKMDFVETITSGCEWNGQLELFPQRGTQHFVAETTLRLDV